MAWAMYIVMCFKFVTSLNTSVLVGEGASSDRVIPNISGLSMALSRTYHYDTYRDELGKAYPGFGHALWEPNPGDYPPVEVGDVGFIRAGKFHRLFNALLPRKHPSHKRRGVPEYHKQLRPQLRDHIDRGDHGPTNFHSHGVTVVSGGLEVLATG